MNDSAEDQARHGDSVFEKFESLWQNSPNPDLEEFLKSHGLTNPEADKQQSLLVEILSIDLERRFRLNPQGDDQALVKPYLLRFTKLSLPVVKQLVHAEWHLRCEAGHTLSASDFVRQMPGLEQSVANDLIHELVSQQAMAMQSQTHVERSTANQSGKESPGLSNGRIQNLSLGTRIRQYEILERIASGGMGIVFKARDLPLQRIVALKVINDSNCASEEVLARFRLEATAAAQLEHPGIVQVFDSGINGPLPFIAMSFVEGECLATFARNQHLSSRKVAELCCRIADAMHYAHEKGVVHRDLNPNNILIDQNGEARITDFGLAKWQFATDKLTTTGQLLGTPAYMSPEQARGDHTATGPTSDVYAIGAILYFCLTQVAPFRGANPVETLRRVLEEEVIRPSRIDPDIDRDLETLCLKCMEKNPRDRVPSAFRLSVELRRYLEGKPISYRRLGPAAKTFKWCKRNPRLTFTLLTILVATAAVSVATQRSAESTRQKAILAMTNDVRSQLNQTNLSDTDHVKIREQMVRLEQMSVEQHQLAKAEVTRILGQQVDRRIAVARLKEEDFSALEHQIKFLKIWDPLAANRYTDAIAQRRRGWRVVAEWDSSNTVGDTMFSSGAVRRRDGNLFVSETARTVFDDSVQEWLSPLAQTKYLAIEDSAIHVQFGDNWKAAHCLGVAIHSGTDSKYEFLIRGSSVGTSERMVSMREAEAVGERCVVEIRRQGRILQQRVIDVKSLPEDRLTVTARREGGQLQVQAGSLPPLHFTDSLILNTGLTPIAVRAEPSVSISAVTIERKPIAHFSLLERGDSAFIDAQYSTAARLYQEQAAGSADLVVAEESRLKSALCAAQTNDLAGAISLLENLTSEGKSQWSVLAGFHLCRLRIQAGQRTDAEELLTFLAGSHDGKHLAELIPLSLWEDICRPFLFQTQNLSSILQPLPGKIDALQALSALSIKITPDGVVTANALLELVVALREADRYEEAIRVLQMVHPKGLDHFNWIRTRIFENRTLRALGRPTEALRRIDTAIKNLPFAMTNTSRLELAQAITLVHCTRLSEAFVAVNAAYEKAKKDGRLLRDVRCSHPVRILMCSLWRQGPGD